MKRLFKAEGLTFHDIADRDRELQRRDRRTQVHRLRRRDHLQRAASRRAASNRPASRTPPEFYDSDGSPRWHEIALFCQNTRRLRSEKEQEFVADMAGKTLVARADAKQAKWLLAIFCQIRRKAEMSQPISREPSTAILRTCRRRWHHSLA